MKFCRIHILVFSACLLGALATPVPADDGIPWHRLSDSEQEILKKHRRKWSDMDQGKQQRLREGARGYLNLPPDKREAVRRKRDEYQRMSPEERERLRKKYRRERR